ncbi:mandelate racemase/muconate lactonizing enzyme family protein [Falsiroseomonas selenitidurans]|uniref:Mandelate racemase/muconate lactonizing enzyme family protein n=1 Tax=Falsiroseomonas selenitidurans TaxID=2716335 RepID=A0ABX1E213_9PROT|nr:mandelate racemase/muconate lactonizing enzyme family protein [Falsiroseomonas selenitidurans]NKC31199.1 mandelate racemase/muconate lactonizing enzyme family protein [Falsiroseomonas selenitidurans]
MKITGVETHLHRSAFTYGAGAQGGGGNLRLSAIDTLLVRVAVEGGLHGWGEGFGFTLAATTRDAVERLIAPACLGQDARDIAGIGALLHRRFHNFGRNGPVGFGIAAIDIALWDIAAKAAGLPLHALLGPAGRRQVPAYASLLRYGDAEAVARNTARAIGAGYRRIKLHEVDMACIRAARAAAPAEVPIMLDVNCAWSDPAAARAFREGVAGMNIGWLEEPIWPPEDFAALAALRALPGCPISAGENLGGPVDFARAFAAGAVDVAQPSVTKHGGLSGLREVQALAAAAGVAVVPHSPYFGPGLLATLHWLAAAEEAAPIEIYFADLATPPYGAALAVRDGQLAVPQGPGLGLEPVGL